MKNEKNILNKINLNFNESLLNIQYCDTIPKKPNLLLFFNITQLVVYVILILLGSSYNYSTNIKIEDISLFKYYVSIFLITILTLSVVYQLILKIIKSNDFQYRLFYLLSYFSLTILFVNLKLTLDLLTILNASLRPSITYIITIFQIFISLLFYGNVGFISFWLYMIINLLSVGYSLYITLSFDSYFYLYEVSYDITMVTLSLFSYLIEKHLKLIFYDKFQKANTNNSINSIIDQIKIGYISLSSTKIINHNNFMKEQLKPLVYQDSDSQLTSKTLYDLSYKSSKSLKREAFLKQDFLKNLEILPEMNINKEIQSIIEKSTNLNEFFIKASKELTLFNCFSYIGNIKIDLDEATVEYYEIYFKLRKEDNQEAIIDFIFKNITMAASIQKLKTETKLK